MNHVVFALLVSLLGNLSCAQKPQNGNVTQKVPRQGIYGVVVIKRGNYMPSPDAPIPAGQPVEREILVFPLLNIREVEAGENGFIKSIGNKQPVKTVRSNKKGQFSLELPVGIYSILVRESKGLYANLYDSQNNIFPMRIQKRQRNQVTIEITHEATF